MVFMCYERSPLLLRDWRAEFVRSVYKQNTVQMIYLVLKHAREKSLRTQGDFFPLPVEKRHANARIHDYERFPVCRNHGETHAVIHLRRSKPYPVRGWHGFEHVINELLGFFARQFLFRQRFGLLTEESGGDGDNREYHR